MDVILGEDTGLKASISNRGVHGIWLCLFLPEVLGYGSSDAINSLPNTWSQFAMKMAAARHGQSEKAGIRACPIRGFMPQCLYYCPSCCSLFVIVPYTQLRRIFQLSGCTASGSLTSPPECSTGDAFHPRKYVDISKAVGCKACNFASMFCGYPSAGSILCADQELKHVIDFRRGKMNVMYYRQATRNPRCLPSASS